VLQIAMKQQTSVQRSQGTAATAAAIEAGMTNRPFDVDLPLKPVIYRATCFRHKADAQRHF